MSAELVEETPAEARARTMQVRALRRLSECEVAGLGLALAQLAEVEAALIETMPKLRDAATKEANVRSMRGLPPSGPYVRGWSASRDLLALVEAARDELTVATSTRRVRRG